MTDDLRARHLADPVQVQRLRDSLAHNDLLMAVLTRARDMALPGWFLTAGCVFQNVWNHVAGYPANHGVRDYDLFYFDDSDLSWDAEDAVIRSAATIFGDLPATVEVRNEARVPLWYEDKFGTPCPPLRSVEDAIDTFPAASCCIGIRLEPSGTWTVYAPHGIEDAFTMVVRPNPAVAPRQVYVDKTTRWQQVWPSLTVHPWPSHTRTVGGTP